MPVDGATKSSIDWLTLVAPRDAGRKDVAVAVYNADLDRLAVQALGHGRRVLALGEGERIVILRVLRGRIGVVHAPDGQADRPRDKRADSSSPYWSNLNRSQ